MGSWQARVADRAIRVFVRRRDWGDEQALVRRARRVFGAPAVYARWAARGLRCERVERDGPRGEWVTPPAFLPGVVLYLHGGGFVSCSATTHRPITFSPSTIAVAGDSAGGNLALALAIRLRNRGGPRVGCVVAFSPWTDLAGRGESVRSNEGRCAMFHPENIRDFASAALGARGADLADVSPGVAELHDLPPVLIHVGSTELLLDDARRIQERIRTSGGACDLRIYEGVPHGWQMFVPFVPEAAHSARGSEVHRCCSESEEAEKRTAALAGRPEEEGGTENPLISSATSHADRVVRSGGRHVEPGREHRDDEREGEHDPQHP